MSIEYVAREGLDVLGPEYRADVVKWLESSKLAPKGVSDFGAAVGAILARVWRGIYHIDERALAKCDWSTQRFIELRLRTTSLATFDGDELTGLVVLCHALAIRLCVSGMPGPQGALRLIFHPRKRDDAFCYRHPTLETAAAKWVEARR